MNQINRRRIQRIRQQIFRLETALTKELDRAYMAYGAEASKILAGQKKALAVKFFDDLTCPVFEVKDSRVRNRLRNLMKKSDDLHQLPQSDTMTLPKGFRLHVDHTDGAVEIRISTRAGISPNLIDDALARMAAAGWLNAGLSIASYTKKTWQSQSASANSQGEGKGNQDCGNTEHECVTSDTEEKLAKMGYSGFKQVNVRWYCLFEFAFTDAIIELCDDPLTGYSDRWCYEKGLAAPALDAFADGHIEPSGWHRHPNSGRRRPDGAADREYVNP